MSNDVVIAREKCQELRKLVGDEREIVATFLLRLVEFNRDNLHEELGFSSLWYFCHRGLGLCESTAGRRVKAVQVLSLFPVGLDYLRDGRLCVTRLLLLSDVLTPENASNLFERASRKSIDDIEHLVAEANPRPAPPARVRKFPEPRPVPEAPGFNFDAAASQDATPAVPVDAGAQAETEPAPAPSREPEANETPLPRPRRRSKIKPTSAQEYSARFPVSREWMGKLKLAKKLGSHVVPTGDPVAILELALDLFIEKHGKRRGAIAPKQPRAKPAPAPEAAEPQATAATAPTKNRFTAADRRTIWESSGGRCVWPMDEGGVCGSEWQLEADHVEAKARGGASEPESARLLCRRHNDQHARDTFGEAFMQAKKQKVATKVASSSGGGTRGD